MTFTPKDWINAPTATTPIDAASLIDLETRVTDYVSVAFDSVEVGDGLTLDTTDPDAPVLSLDPDDPPWIYVNSGSGIAPPFLNGATNLGSGFAAAAFRQLSNGDVQMRGHVVCAADTIFTLPAGYCPPYALILDAAIAPTPGQLIIYANGSVEFNQTPSGFGTLNTQFQTT